MDKQLKGLILQSLEHQRGGVHVDEKALESAENEDLHQAWTECLAQTRNHVQILEGICKKFEIAPGLRLTP